MTFIEAIKSGYQGYVGFSGRSRRSAYWYWVLYQIIAQVVLGLVFGGGERVDGGFVYNANMVANLWSLAHFLPGLALGIRRLHDTDRSGWWTLLVLIPLVGWIVLIVFAAQKGTAGANRFGGDPSGDARVF